MCCSLFSTTLPGTGGGAGDRIRGALVAGGGMRDGTNPAICDDNDGNDKIDPVDKHGDADITDEVTTVEKSGTEAMETTLGIPSPTQ